MSSYTYKKIWESHFGKIPKDDDGRTYEIHHIDGNRDNNDISNLMCVSIKEHYDIHYKQGDYGACVMIAKRMDMPPGFLSEIQRGKKRPGIGGVKKGTIPWNKDKPGYKLNLSDDARFRMGSSNRNNPKNKIKDEDKEVILKDYENKVEIKHPKLGKVQRNGKVFTYERAFSYTYAEKYNVHNNYIYQIITKKI